MNILSTGNRRVWSGLRAKITMQMLVASLVPAILLAAISLVTLQGAFGDISTELDEAHELTATEGGEDLGARAFLIARRLDEYMLERLDNVAEWVVLPSIVQATQQGALIAEEEALVGRSIETVERLQRNDRELNNDETLHGLLTQLVETTAFSEIFFTETHGYNVAVSSPTSDFVQSDEEWWTVAWQEGIYIDEIEYDDSAGIYAVAIAMRIDDPATGQPLGVLKAALDVGRLQGLVNEEAETLTEGSVLIFQVSDGYRIADTAVEHDPALILTEEGALQGDDYLPAELVTELQSGESAYVILGADESSAATDQAYVTGYARTSGTGLYGKHNDFAGFDWAVAVSQPEDVVLRVVQDLAASQEQLEEQSSDLVALFAGIGLATLVGGIVLATWQTRIVVNPITRLQQTALQLSEGDLSARSTVASQDELGDLAQAFNRMAGDLEQMMVSERDSKAHLENTVNEYMGFVESVASGDLTRRLQLNGNGRDSSEADDDLYKLGKNLNLMAESLNGITLQVRQTTTSVVSSASEIQAATTQQTASSVEQDATVTQTVATLEEVRQTVLQTAERAQQVADTALQSVDVSREGQNAVSDTVDGMNLIRERVESIAETILSLSERTQQIGEIIDAVNALADQSKMLALNASIEAARAGEEGKGFAVVAMEVRQLAEQSREATARVSVILSEIQQATNTAVMVTEEGSKGAEAGMELVERTGEAIRDLTTTIEQAAQAATQIAASTQQQTNGMDQLTMAMGQIKQATAQAAASTRQTEESVRNLLDMAHDLDQATTRYELA
jgi:methyl-accepting chemotaxis protein